MAKMNWEKARYEYRAAQGSSYGERLDEAEDRWAQRDAEREARKASNRRDAASANLPKGELLALNADAQKLGIDLSRTGWPKLLRLFGQVEQDAKRYRIDPRELRRRRLKVMRGHSVEAILAAGRLDQSPKRVAGQGRAVSPPISTVERLRQEAAQRGQSLQELAAPPRVRAQKPLDSASLISSAGRERPLLKVSRPAPPPAPAQLTKKQQKRQRDFAAAAKLGITVEELRSRRRTEHQARAERKGTS